MITLYKKIGDKIHSSEFPKSQINKLKKLGWSKTKPKKKEVTK